MVVMAGSATLCGMLVWRPTAVNSTGTMLEHPSPTSAYPTSASGQDAPHVASRMPRTASAPPAITTRCRPARATMRSPVRRPKVMASENAAKP